jgi:flagellar biosynthesis/type III secretory pathway protein FliH
MADAFAPIAQDVRTAGFAPTFLIAALDAARREAAAAEALPAPEPEPDPVIAVLAEARRIAFAEGHAAGLREAEAAAPAIAAQAATLALDALRAGHAAAAEAARNAAEDVARLALAMLDAALPGLAAQNGAALVAAFARRLRPMLESAPEARLLVAPGLVEATRALLGTATIAIEEDAALPPGDARAEWRSGGAALDLAARRQAIRGVLEAAGLGPRE